MPVSGHTPHCNKKDNGRFSESALHEARSKEDRGEKRGKEIPRDEHGTKWPMVTKWSHGGKKEGRSRITNC